MSVDAALLRAWFAQLAESVRGEKDHLTRLDTAIGDGDHGVNLERGVTALAGRLDGLGTPAEVLGLAGRTLISTVGGASGPLFGTVFREAAKRLPPGASVDDVELADALLAGLAAAQRLGSAEPGDKTMVDALRPGLLTLQQRLRAGVPLLEAAADAAEVAVEGARSTVSMQARKGRASYLGPRSLGHEDPGAVSAALVLSALQHATAAAASTA